MKPLNLNTSHLFILTGIPGAGKTYFGDQFSKSHKLPMVSNSHMLEMLFEKPEFSKDEQVIVQRINLNELHQLFKTKSSIIYDGITDSRVSRQEVAKLAVKEGYTPIVVWVQTDAPTAEYRVTHKNAKPVPMGGEAFSRQVKKFTAPNQSENHIVISGKHTPASQIRTVLSKIAKE